MLASITPLGERSRGFSWRLTASAFILGATAAGATAGAAAGALGSLTAIGAGTRAAALGVVIALALLFDSSLLSRRLPTMRRQVNEDWLARYRGWVYGLGFGLQLGMGLATIVTSAAVYAAAAAALLCATPLAGLAVGGVFGGVRGVSLLAARRVRSPGDLLVLHRRLERLDRSARRAVPATELALMAVVAAALIG